MPYDYIATVKAGVAIVHFGGQVLHVRAMPQTCVVVGCTNRWGKQTGRIFFQFPVDESQRLKWIVAVNRKDWSPTEYSCVCSDHFISGKLYQIIPNTLNRSFVCVCVCCVCVCVCVCVTVCVCV